MAAPERLTSDPLDPWRKFVIGFVFGLVIGFLLPFAFGAGW
jgi:hypothetical protein